MNEDNLDPNAISNLLNDDVDLDPDAAELLKDLDDDEDDEKTLVRQRPAINTLSVSKAISGSPALTPTCELITYAGPRTGSNNAHSAFAASQINLAVPAALNAVRSSKSGGLAPAPLFKADEDKEEVDDNVKTDPFNKALHLKDEIPAEPTNEDPLKLDEPETAKEETEPAKEETQAEAEVKAEAAAETKTEESTDNKVIPEEEPQNEEKAEEKSDSAEKAETSDKEATEENAETPAEKRVEPVSAATPQKPPIVSSGPRPSIPPPMPSGSPVSRIIKDNEIVVTKDYISEIVAGGRLDEAKDLEKHTFQDNGWYSQIFNADFFRTIPKNSEKQTRREVNFILEQLGLETDATILDLCCGYGRHTLELAKHGMNMVGMDLSMDMLRAALDTAQKSKLSVKLIHGDMQKLAFKSIFDGVFNVQTSFGYFNDQKNFKVLQGILRSLKPGGRFLIETINRDFIMDEIPMRIWWQGKECTILEEIDVEFQRSILKVKRSFVFDEPGRQPWEQYINIRLYSATELTAMLERAGFEVLELSGDYSLPGHFFGATSPKVIILAERPC